MQAECGCGEFLCFETKYGHIGMCKSCLVSRIQSLECDFCKEKTSFVTGSIKYIEIVICATCKNKKL